MTNTSPPPKSTKPRREQNTCHRPLGLALAIIGAGLLYGVYPVLPLALLLWSQSEQRLVGVDFIGGPLGYIIMTLGILVIVACIAAWRGRPRQIRAALIGLLWLTTAAHLYRLYGIAETGTFDGGVVGGNITVGGVSTSSIPFTVIQTVVLVLIPLYATWYMNRAPARRFYACRNNQDVT